MGTQIGVTVKNKIAAGDGSIIVCGNKHYSVKFAFDDEWSAYDEKTMRVRFSGAYIDVPFTGDTAPLPIITNTIVCEVGVYAGNLETTTPAYFDCKKSILCNSGQQIIPVEPVIEPLEIAENGTYTAPESIDGYSPVTVDVQPPLEEKEITENGEYTPSAGFYGMGKVNVKVGNLPQTKGFVPTAWNDYGSITDGFWYGGNIPAYYFGSGKSSSSAPIDEIAPFNFKVFPKINDPTLEIKIGSYGFRDNNLCDMHELPAQCVGVGDGAFYRTQIKNISIHSSVKNMGNYAFMSCTALESVTIWPKLIGLTACFQGCTNLSTINVSWSEGEVGGAPWGATNATINYNYTGE